MLGGASSHRVDLTLEELVLDVARCLQCGAAWLMRCVGDYGSDGRVDANQATAAMAACRRIPLATLNPAKWRDNGAVPRVLTTGALLTALTTGALCLSARSLGWTVGSSSTSTAAQPEGSAFRTRRPDEPTYDGRYTFVRLRWRPEGGRFRGFWSSAWDHDYPRAERHLAQILSELTDLDVQLDASRILTLDDPELFRYPIAFMWEPGFWTMTDGEAQALRAYLLKGGFAVFEDFDGPSQWANFEQQVRRALPDARFVRLDKTHPIFRAFFEVHDIDAIVHPMSGQRPSYLGVFEDNDPSRRLLIVANFDNDVPEYWEWSGEGLYPFSTSNEAYKLGVNYTIYGHTH